jgi:GNAT superfamily N-acetyltransferase
VKSLEDMFDSYATERGFGPRIFHVPGMGFATYHINVNGECYIEDIYVIPEERRSGLATKMADGIAFIAKEKGCNILTGSVVPSAKGADDSRNVLASYGFVMFEKSMDLEKYAKEI